MVHYHQTQTQNRHQSYTQSRFQHDEGIVFVRPARNRLGVVGFIISLLAILTCGVLSPIGLLVSLVGMRRRPRGLATAGAILGLLGTAFVASWVGMMAVAGEEAQQTVRRHHTVDAIAQADKEVWREIANLGKLPEGIEGNKIVIKHNDAWGNALRYDRKDNEFLIRSAGPDGQFETGDDLTSARSTYESPPSPSSPEQPIPLE